MLPMDDGQDPNPDEPPAASSGAPPDPPLPPTIPTPTETPPPDDVPTVDPDSLFMPSPQVQPSPADIPVDPDDDPLIDSQRLGGDATSSAPSFRPSIGPDAPASPRPRRSSGAAPPPSSPDATPAKKAKVAPPKKHRRQPGEPSSSSQLPPDDSPELIPDEPPLVEDGSKKVPDIEDDDEDEQEDDDDNETTSNTTPDPDDPEVQYVDDVIIDEADWPSLSVEEKIASNTGSFSYMSWEDKFINDTFLTKHNIGTRTRRLNKTPVKAFNVDLNAPGITDDDRAVLTLYTKQHEVYAAAKGPKTLTQVQAKKRKEASLKEIREFYQGFKKAKETEIQSWLDNEVFDLVDTRYYHSRNWVTGRWVLTVKRDKDGNFLKCKARSSFRLAVQQAANKRWNLFHMDLKTACLQGEAYDNTRDILCQIPPGMGYPPYIAALMKKPAYGLNDAPRRWWNVVDSALKKFGLVPTCAD